MGRGLRLALTTSLSSRPRAQPQSPRVATLKAKHRLHAPIPSHCVCPSDPAQARLSPVTPPIIDSLSKLTGGGTLEVVFGATLAHSDTMRRAVHSTVSNAHRCENATHAGQRAMQPVPAQAIAHVRQLRLQNTIACIARGYCTI